MSPIGDTYHRACLLECGDPTSSVDIIEQSVLIALLPTLDPTTAREKEREGAESFPAFWFLLIEAMDPRPGAAGGGGRAVVVRHARIHSFRRSARRARHCPGRRFNPARNP